MVIIGVKYFFFHLNVALEKKNWKRLPT